MNAWEDESRIATMERTNEEYHSAGPSQYPFRGLVQEKQPMTPAARMVLWYESAYRNYHVIFGCRGPSHMSTASDERKMKSDAQQPVYTATHTTFSPSNAR